MAINKKLIHFENKENFENEVANRNILDHSIVFIQDSKEISTHGTIYKSVNWSVLEQELYQWVDLGLPSGTLWADRNVGAVASEDPGLYFAWGETEGYSDITDAKQFNWNDYTLCNGSDTTLIKYNRSGSNGIVDNLYILEQVDDAAYQSDSSCQIPSMLLYVELVDNTSLYYIENYNETGISGYEIVSHINGNHIFMPCGKGGLYNGSTFGDSTSVYYWTNSLRESDATTRACYYAYTSDGGKGRYGYRCFGMNLRPVKIV